MKPATCSRLFEAEAARDGRLTGVERENFERHAKTCSACARERAELAALAEDLRKPEPSPGDELHAQREKLRLLAAFDRQLLAPVRASRPQRWLLWSAALVVLAAAGLGLRELRSRQQVADVSGRPASVRAEPATAWSERVDGARELIVLEHGTLWIRVDHTRSTRRVMVALPDGELEDIGTTFTVSATDGHTTRVAVEEGRVVLRLRNQQALGIAAGKEWTPPPRTTPAPAASAAPTASSTPSSEPSAASSAVTSHGAARPAAAHASDAAAEFREAMAALNRGDDAEAAQGFAAFVQRHPRDGRAEDAAYLRVLALQRAGNHAGLAAAAADFLRHYPSGFRRAEVEGLLR